MMRTAFRMLRRLSPRAAQIVLDVYLNLRGSRIAEMQAELHALRHRPEAHQPSEAALQDSLGRIGASRAAYSGAIAVISAMPPMETGIANFTRSTFRHADYPVDIYTAHSNFFDYADNLHDPLLAGSNVRVFDLQALSHGRHKMKYAVEIYVLGNSRHNLESYRALRRTASSSGTKKVWVHIHDPCLLNILHLVSDTRERFTGAIRTAYPDLAAGLDMAKAADDHRMLTRVGIMGVRAMLRGIQVDRFVVNSKAAGDLLRSDDPSLPPDRILQLFHPVFPVPRYRGEARQGPTLIGTFGVPSTAKRTELVIEAVRLLRQQISDATLLIAGYDAAAYAAQNGIETLPFVRIEDAPGDRTLLELMRSVDIAVQLRSSNLGESSGAVPQLLASGVPVIVTAVGSFVEYGDAVQVVPRSITAAELATILLTGLQSLEQRRHSVEQYVATHGPEKFCQQLVESLPSGNRVIGKCEPSATSRHGC